MSGNGEGRGARKRSPGPRARAGRRRRSGPEAAARRGISAEARQAVFGEILRELAAEDDFERLFALIGERVCRLLGTDSASVLLVDDGELVLRGFYGFEEAMRPTPRRKIADSRAGRVVLTGRPHTSSDMRNDSHWRDARIVTQFGYRAVLEAPIRLRGQVVGVLAALQKAPRVFSEEEAALLTALADHTAGALDRTNLLRELQVRLRETQTLLSVSQAVSTTLDLTETLRRVARETARTLAADTVGAFLADAGEVWLRPLAGYHVPKPLLADVGAWTIPLRGHPFFEAAWTSRRPLVAADAATDPRLRDVLAPFPARSLLFVPMVVKDAPIGGLLVLWWDRERALSAEELRLVEGIGRQAGLAIDNARLFAETERRRRTAEVLAEVGRLVSETLEPDVVGQRIADSVRGLLGAHASTLYLAGEGSPRFLELATSENAFPRGTGLIGVTVGTRRPVVTPDFLADPGATPTPDVRAALERSGFRAVLAVPLAVKDRVIGALAVADRTGRVFDAEAIALAQIFADQAAVALENARLFAETGERLRETETLLAVAQILSRSLPLDEALRQVARAVGRAFGADMVGAYFLDAGREALVPVAGYRVPKDLLPTLLQTPFPLARFPILREAWETRRPVWTADYGGDPRVDPEFMAGMQPRALLFAPTPVRGEVVGGLFITWWATTRSFGPAELRLIEGVASQVGLALENAELVRQTQQKLQETETLLTVSHALSSTLDLQPLLRHFLRQVARTTEADSVGVWLVDEATGALEPHTGYRVPQPILDRVRAYRIRPAESPFYAEGIASRRALVSTDVPDDPRIPASLKAIAPHRAQLFGPIVARERVVAAFIAVWWERTREFSARELALVEAMGSQAGVALENARLFQAHQRKLEELSVLYELSRAVTGQLDVERLVQTVHQQVGRVLDARNMVLFFFDEARREFEVALRMFDGAPDPNPVRRYPMGFGLMSRVVERRHGIRTTDYEAACRAEAVQPIKTSLTLPHWLGVPMIAGDEMLGVLALRDAVRPFTEADERLLTNIAGVVALALRGARLFTEKSRAHDELRAAQDQLIRSERLRALGEMAAGVAHDFNNVLAAIMGRAQILLTQIEEPGYRRQLQIIERAAMDGARTVRRIQEFTRMRRARPFEPVDLNQVLDEVVEVTRARWEDEALAKGITYEVRAEPTPVPSIAADPSEIREVLTNLVLNALDAMPDGGRVTLRTAADREYVVCTVTDTGIGMTEEVRQRVFDPFFTTKAEKGTGLGLSVAYGIITRHGGEIEVQSQPWQGSSFTIRLPAARRAPARRARGETPAARPARVLIIDDEESVRQVLAEMLMAQGHTVAAHGDGRSALARFHDEPFDVVFTDLGLPGLSGWEVARLVKVRRPETPVVLVTGWSDQIEPDDVHWRGIDFVVAKPFEVEDIRGVLARALGAGA